MQKGEVDVVNVLDKSTAVSPQRLLYVNQLEGAYFQVSCVYAEAYPIFNTLPESVLPPLPWGYIWARDNGRHCIIRDSQSFESTFHLKLYGPNEHNQINFLFQVHRYFNSTELQIENSNARTINCLQALQLAKPQMLFTMSNVAYFLVKN